ncbi:MAG TPA: hypothetical protein VLS89_14315, partial [Candidatus Nanopelagicales bacterium]|nr:hypothetical protein [Candidatus Nanopelagicales bacterium]
TLEAIFLVRDALGTQSLRLRRKLDELEKAGVKIFLHDAAERQLRWVVRDWVLDRARAAASGGAT